MPPNIKAIYIFEVAFELEEMDQEVYGDMFKGIRQDICETGIVKRPVDVRVWFTVGRVEVEVEDLTPEEIDRISRLITDQIAKELEVKNKAGIHVRMTKKVSPGSPEVGG